MILMIRSFLVRQLFAWLLILGTTNGRSTSRDQYRNRAREYGIEPNTILPPRPAIVSLATHTRHDE